MATLQTIRQGGTQHPEEIVNFLDAALVQSSGIIGSNSFEVTEEDTPGMSVKVAEGKAVIKTSDSVMAHGIRLYNGAESVTINANAAGNPRIDAIVLYIDRGAAANATVTNVAKLVAVDGTAAASPSAPSDSDITSEIGASNPFIRLANVTVASGASSILDANISDTREGYSLVDSVYYNGKDRQGIINGNFDIWQRGTSFTDNEYTADRWLQSRTGSSSTTTRQAFTLGQSDVPGNPKYYLRSTVTSSAGASNSVAIQQRIESVTSYANDSATVTFYAKADGTKNIAVSLTQDFGTGGSPSSDVNISPKKVQLTTSWQKFSLTFDVPSVTGKTLGTANDDHLKVVFWLDAGSSLDTITDSLGQQSIVFDISRVQVNRGKISIPYLDWSIDQELSLCRRYCEVIGYDFSDRDISGVGYFSDTNTAVFSYTYKNRKRALPSVTYPTGVAGDNDYTISKPGTTLFADNSTFSGVAAGKEGVVFLVDTVSGTGTAGDGCILNVRSGEALIIIESEL